MHLHCDDVDDYDDDDNEDYVDYNDDYDDYNDGDDDGDSGKSLSCNAKLFNYSSTGFCFFTGWKLLAHTNNFQRIMFLTKILFSTPFSDML